MGNKSHYDPTHKRVFVREISGEYSLKHELKRLRDLPRVQKGDKVTFQSGPQAFSKHFMEPEDGLGQTLHIHLEEYAPGGRSQMHGHVNEAVFYILDGRGYELHDGVRYDWKVTRSPFCTRGSSRSRFSSCLRLYSPLISRTKTRL